MKGFFRMAERITIYSLANEIGVTATMVSRAFTPNAKINPEKRKMILREAELRGFVPNKNASRLSMKTMKIGVIICGRIPEFYNEYLNGLRDEANELLAFKVDCDIRTVDDNKEDSEKELLKILKEFEDNGVEGIIVSGLYRKEVCKRLEELFQKGIKIANVGGESNDYPMNFSSQCNVSASANIAAEMLSLIINNSRKRVLIFTGDLKTILHIKLRDSFREAAKKYGLEIVEEIDTIDIAEQAEKMAKKAFSKYNDIDGIYISSANSIKILETVKKLGLGGKIKIITSDVFDELKPYLDEEIVTATIYQDPYHQAKRNLEKLYNYIAYGEKVSKIIFTDPVLVMRSNWNLLYGSNRTVNKL